MNCKIRILTKYIGLIAAFAVGSVSCFSTPSTARVINSDVVSVQIGEAEKKAVINSNLLTEEGQIVLVNSDLTEPLVVPITVSCENMIQQRSAAAGTVQAVSSNEEKLQAAVDTTTVVLQEENSVINLTLTMVQQEAEEDGETESSTESESDTESDSSTESETDTNTEIETESPDEGENTETPDTEGSGEEIPDKESGEGTDSAGESTENTQNTGADSTNETNQVKEVETGTEAMVRFLRYVLTGTGAEATDVEETATEQPVTEETDTGQPAVEPDAEPVTEPAAEPDAEPVTEPETETDTEPIMKPETETDTESVTDPVTENETQTTTETDAEQETEPEAEETAEQEDDTLYAEVSFTYGGQTLSATFVVADEDETATGELAYCTGQYDPAGSIVVVGDAETDCTISEFPAMTGYRFDEESYLLYDGGSIQIPAGKEVRIFLPEMEKKEDFTITTANGTVHTVKYIEHPELSEDIFPLVIDGKGITLPITKWGAIAPVVRVEHLTMENEELVWKTSQSVTAELNEKGKLEIEPETAEAGTYRMNVSWSENEVTLYEMEIPFFIQYHSAAQGGSGQ